MAKSDIPSPPRSGLWKIDILDPDGYIRREEAFYDRGNGQFFVREEAIIRNSIIAWQTVDGSPLNKKN